MHAPPLFSCRGDACDRAAPSAARVCVHDRSHKWHECRRFSPLYGSRRSGPLFVLRRVGCKRGRLVRSEFSSSKRLPFTGWSQSGGDISQLVLPDIAASVNTSAHNCSTLVRSFRDTLREPRDNKLLQRLCRKFDSAGREDWATAMRANFLACWTARPYCDCTERRRTAA